MEKILNWEEIFQKSSNFKQNNPTKWAYVENFFEGEVYNELYKTYPKFNESWKSEDSYDKCAYRKYWGEVDENKNLTQEQDDNFSEAWNKFLKYLHSDSFIENIRKFSGIPVTKIKKFQFTLIRKNGFQLPHIHNMGPSTIIIMAYFSKNWEEGKPGGTYVATGEDESKMVFEPYNLDNSAMIFHDGPFAAHGVRRITDDVERRGIQIYLEEYSTENGWSGDKKEQELIEL
tara:strand:- start:408 stop:1100 length:693 start_codon:yes stop_codon:yes gene_type:complete